jgi:hypothetical protein
MLTKISSYSSDDVKDPSDEGCWSLRSEVCRTHLPRSQIVMPTGTRTL